MADEYNNVGFATKENPKSIGDHNVVAIGDPDLDIFHSARKQGGGYTKKYDTQAVKRIKL